MRGREGRDGRSRTLRETPWSSRLTGEFVTRSHTGESGAILRPGRRGILTPFGGNARHHPQMEPDQLLADYPGPMQDIAQALRRIVRRTIPDAIERVRPGWRLIGYDVPVGRGTRYVAFVWAEPEHVHLGFEVGTLMNDPDGVLEGAHLKLRKVRFLTFATLDAVDEAACSRLLREAVRVVSLPADERRLLASRIADDA